jgi:hypothetical protein
MSLKIFIPGNVPSSKNSRRWTGKYSIASKQTYNYWKESNDFWKNNADKVVKYLKNKPSPYMVHFKFYRKSKHKFDYINPAQTVQDLMVRFNWISDDNADVIIPVFEEYVYSPKNPGVEIIFP